MIRLLPDYIMRMDIVSDQGMFPLPRSIVKQKACKSTLQAILIGPAKWSNEMDQAHTIQGRSWSVGMNKFSV